MLALDRTAGGVPGDAVDYLLEQQCSDGSFRLYQFGYVLSFDPFETVDTHTCDDPAEGDADATAFALHGAPRGAVVRRRSSGAIDGAVDFLLGQQQASGGFFGTGAVNSNTTGLAAAALRARRGRTKPPMPGPRSSPRCRATRVTSSAPSPTTKPPSTPASTPTVASGPAPPRRGRSGLGLPAYGGIGTRRAGGRRARRRLVPGDARSTRRSITASASLGDAGGDLTLTGVGFTPGETVDITLHSTPIHLGSATADADGTVVGDRHDPGRLEPGVHTIEMVGQTSGVTVSTQIEVRGGEPAPVRTRCPRPGRRPASSPASGLASSRSAPRSLVAGRRRLAACDGADGRPDPAPRARPRRRARRAGSGRGARAAASPVGRRPLRRARAPTRPASPSSST